MKIKLNQSLIAALRKNGLAVVQNYTWSKVSELWFAVYMDALQDDR
jgi:hypothetical protein